MPAKLLTKPRSHAGLAGLDPFSLTQMYVGVQVPDIITFVVGEQWLNLPNLYPRQATILKILFLRDDLFTDYDNALIDAWEQEYLHTGKSGLVPNIRYRIRWLKARGAKWFHEVLLVLGRRASKGYMSSVALSYIIWNYMAKGNPQKAYGLQPGKPLTMLIYAAKKDQAKANVFGDVANMVADAPCFQPWISRNETERLSIYAPHDKVRLANLVKKGVVPKRDIATFQILPKESTPGAGRGPASFAIAMDEMAFVEPGGSTKDAAAVYKAAKPSLGQFKQDSFIIEPSSPWNQTGQFWDNWLRAIATDDDGIPLDPDFFGLQLASWDVYKDYELTQSGEFALFPEDFEGDLGEYAEIMPPYAEPLYTAIQEYDEEMQREERANPETFAIERRAQWATSLDAYFDADAVDAIFKPWQGRLPFYGSPQLIMSAPPRLDLTYRGHGDPGHINDRFGLAVAHVEADAEGRPHCVFDVLHYFDPRDFPQKRIRYEHVIEWIFDNLIKRYMPEAFTFDHWNSVAPVEILETKIENARLAKPVSVYIKPTTPKNDWNNFEAAKAAINMGLVHAPFHELARDELRFLQKVNRNGATRVDHPTTGPVTSKDVADPMVEIIASMVGEYAFGLMSGGLDAHLRGAAVGGIDPFPAAREGGTSGTDELDMLTRRGVGAYGGYRRRR